MAKINVVGNAVVLTSSMKYEDVQKAEKYRPDALVLKDEKGKELFKVATGKYPTANEYGVVFNGHTQADGFATGTWIVADEITEDAKEQLADLYGAALLKLGKLEETFGKAIEEIDKEREGVLAQIELS